MLPFFLLSLINLMHGSNMPSKSLGFYCLISDNGVYNYTDHDDWTPELYNYQIQGANVLYLTFIDPVTMQVPKSVQNLLACRGKPGCPTTTQKVLVSVGGYSYSQPAYEWPWLESETAANSMAETVSTWKKVYDIDGIDLDLQSPDGSNTTYARNIVIFSKKLKELNPTFIITQPVYGYPEVQSQNNMVNNGWNNKSESTGLIDTIGIMVFQDLESLLFVPNYANATDPINPLPIKVDVPYKDIVVGIEGTANDTTINELAIDVKNEGLGGIMVWYASVFDKTRNQPALSYGPAMDASVVRSLTGQSWVKALNTLNGNNFY